MYYYVRDEHFCEIFLGVATDLRGRELKNEYTNERNNILLLLS